MRRTILALMILSVLVISMSNISNSKADGDRGVKLKVTVTNLTAGQIESPVVVATHNRELDPLFELGSPASDALAALAEDAINGPLIEALETDPNVKDVQVIFGEVGPIMPGESASVVVWASRKFDRISLASMLVTTNDAFLALNGVRVPRHGSWSFRSPAYDAGSEDNNEDCEFIPGPPCMNMEVRDEDGAEGYVHIHRGVHGIADLIPAQHDWRNPVASISISRMAGDDDDDDDDD